MNGKMAAKQNRQELVESALAAGKRRTSSQFSLQNRLKSKQTKTCTHCDTLTRTNEKIRQYVYD